MSAKGGFFVDQSYHFQTLRVMNDVPSDGADTGEVLETIKHVRSGDAQGWWPGRTLATESRYWRPQPPIGSQRAARYCTRTTTIAQRNSFFPPTTPGGLCRRPRTFDRSMPDSIRLGVAYQQIKAPYGEGHRLGPSTTLPPKVVRRPLIILGGGYDSTLEEDAREHGYAVLTYDGPGQGSVLRDQGLTFAHAWEKPTTAVVDAFLAGHSRPRYMVLVGMSMGG